MAKKVLAVKFDKTDKARFVGTRVGHTRTGACTSKGKCHHGRIARKRVR